MEALALATPHPLATEAGVATFGAGGTAVDAALAAAAVLTVVAPQDCALGGDAIALVATPGGAAPRAVLGAGAAALGVDVEALRARHRTMPVRGPAPITVPGVVDAWATVAGLGARLAWAELLEAAVVHADEGVPASGPLARALVEQASLVAADPGLRDVLAPSGTPLGPGDTLRQPALAESLRLVRDGGREAMYGGEVGAALLAGLAAHGSPLRAEDVLHHVTEVTEPVVGSFSGIEVATAPPPSQGSVLLRMLDAVGALGGVPDPLGDALSELAEISRRAARERDRELGDPRPAPAKRGGDTVAVAAMDTEGYAVSLIQSVFWPFGAGILEPRTGIVCHNRGASFTLDPAAPSVLRGGVRPPHTLMPVLVARDDRVEGAHGTMGGLAQPQIHLQVLLHLLRGAGAQAAVAAPRWIVEPDGVLAIERDAGVAPQGARTYPPHDDELGHAQLARHRADGTLEAGSDPRAGGRGVVVSR